MGGEPDRATAAIGAVVGQWECDECGRLHKVTKQATGLGSIYYAYRCPSDPSGRVMTVIPLTLGEKMEYRK